MILSNRHFRIINSLPVMEGQLKHLDKMIADYEQAIKRTNIKHRKKSWMVELLDLKKEKQYLTQQVNTIKQEGDNPTFIQNPI